MADLTQLSLLDLIGIIRDRYPSLLPFLGKPGVWDLAVRIMQDSNAGAASAWSDARIQEAYRETEYAKTTPQTQQQWDLLTWTDPATAAEQGRRAGQMVEDTANELGLTMSGADKFAMTAAVVTGQWDANRLRYEMLTGNQFAPNNSGDIATNAAAYRGAAQSYGVPITDNVAIDWGKRISAGQDTLANAKQDLAGWAAGLYPALSDHFQQGQTLADFAQPYLQLASNELGVPTNQMNLDDPKWTAMFLGADSKGNQGVMSLQEAQTKLRSDPVYGYDHSPGAAQQASQFANSLLQKFGFGSG